MARAEVDLVAALAPIAADSIFPAGGAQGRPAPYITFQRISVVQSGHLTGGGALDRVRVQIGCWARTALEALTLSAAARDILEPAEGDGIGTFEDERDPQFDVDARLWGVTSDYFIWQERT